MRIMLLPSLGVLLLALTSIVRAETNSAHQQDYLAALEKVIHAESRIAQEMKRVQLGSVAHYDFLQYEHIELVRHARALAFPPAEVSAETRDAIKTQAEQLLTSANDLEWVIADFLRALAQLRSASSNTLDILIPLKSGASPALIGKIEALETAMLLFTVSGYAEEWEVLSAALDAVHEAANVQQRRELAVQQQLLRDNAPVLTVQRQKLVDSDVDRLALQLQLLYAQGQ